MAEEKRIYLPSSKTVILITVDKWNSKKRNDPFENPFTSYDLLEGDSALKIKWKRIEISACSLVKDDKKQKQEGIHSWIEDKDTWYKFSKTNERKKT